MNAKALFQLSYGLYVVSTKYDKKMNGCIINTVTQVTDDPKQIVVAINKKKPDLRSDPEIRDSLCLYSF